MSDSLESIGSIGVVGAGTMGSGIAQVSAMAGYDVVMVDLDEERLESGFESIDESLDRFVTGDRLSAETREEVSDRITGTTEIADLETSDFVIEAVIEELSVKQDVFTDLESVTDEGTVLATNTNTLSITQIATATSRPEDVVGLHFMRPVQIMNGVEVVLGECTGDHAVETAHALAERLGKQTWEVEDKPGFVTNRMLVSWIIEGIRAYDEGIATKEDIDRGTKFGMDVSMGPLELADYIGLDVCLEICEQLSEGLGDRYHPPYLLRRKVEAGHLGEKTGKGFYEYD